MGFKKYIVFSALFIGVIFGYTFSLELGDFKVTLFDISLLLPIAVWIIAPLVVLFIATVLHILFYGLINAFKQRAIEKDKETMINLIKSNLLEKNLPKRFKTKAFKEMSAIISQLKLNVRDSNFTSSDSELNFLISNIQDIKAGKFVSDKSLKLNEKSELSNQNLINKVNEQIDFSVEVLKKSENYPQNIVKQSFINVINEKSMTTVKKLYKNIKLDKDLARRLFEKDAANNEFGFTSEEISKIVKDLEYTTEDYLALARNYESILQPDQIIALFEKLSEEIDASTPAYLHVLFEYEMIDKVREIIDTTPEGEYTSFKALLDLKDAGKHYDLESISYK